MTHNVLQLQEVGDFEAQNCLPPLNRQFLVAAVMGRFNNFSFSKLILRLIL